MVVVAVNRGGLVDVVFGFCVFVKDGMNKTGRISESPVYWWPQV